MDSSIGIIKVNDENDLEKDITKAFRYDQDLLIEEFRECREIFVSVLQRKDKIIVSLLGELIMNHQLYSYEDKYHKNSSAFNLLNFLWSFYGH